MLFIFFFIVSLIVAAVYLYRDKEPRTGGRSQQGGFREDLIAEIYL